VNEPRLGKFDLMPMVWWCSHYVVVVSRITAEHLEWIERKVVDRAKGVGDVKPVMYRMKVLVRKLVEVHRTVNEKKACAERL
jgi:hypothetical protein